MQAMAHIRAAGHLRASRSQCPSQWPNELSWVSNDALSLVAVAVRKLMNVNLACQQSATSERPKCCYRELVIVDQDADYARVEAKAVLA